MKWSYCVIFFLCASLYATSSIEEKLNRLEIESGIKPPPNQTSVNAFGNFLYWKASLDGVAWATTAKVVARPSGGDTLDDFKTRMVHFDYSPAFQVGIGVGLPYDQWDVSVQWLRTDSTGRDHARGDLTIDVGNKIILDEIGLIQGLLTPPNRASAHCRVHLHIIDLVLGRTFFWSKYFVFRPFAGVRGAWLKLDWDLSFTMPIQSHAPLDQTYTFADINNRFNAAGLIGGFESKWNLYRGFGLFSHATASLIYGVSSEKTKQEFFLIPAMTSDLFEQTFSAKNSTHAVKGVFDIAIGLKWEKDLTKRWHLLLRAGYDFFYWPAVTQKTILQITRVRDRSDLSFQGFIVGARLDYQ